MAKETLYGLGGLAVGLVGGYMAKGLMLRTDPELQALAEGFVAKVTRSGITTIMKPKLLLTWKDPNWGPGALYGFFLPDGDPEALMCVWWRAGTASGLEFARMTNNPISIYEADGISIVIDFDNDSTVMPGYKQFSWGVGGRP